MKTHSPKPSAVAVPIGAPLSRMMSSAFGAARPAITAPPSGSMRTTSTEGSAGPAASGGVSAGAEGMIAGAASAGADAGSGCAAAAGSLGAGIATGFSTRAPWSRFATYQPIATTPRTSASAAIRPVQPSVRSDAVSGSTPTRQDGSTAGACAVAARSGSGSESRVVIRGAAFSFGGNSGPPSARAPRKSNARRLAGGVESLPSAPSDAGFAMASGSGFCASPVPWNGGSAGPKPTPFKLTGTAPPLRASKDSPEVDS